MQMNVPDMVYPIQTQSHDCHHDSPPMIIEDDIIHVFCSISVDKSRSVLWKTHDVEAIGDPEAHKIPCTPLPALRFDCQAVLEQWKTG